MIQLRNDVGLIGDFIGTFPVMQALATLHGGLQVQVHRAAIPLFDTFMPRQYNIERVDEVASDAPSLDLSAAFALAAVHNYHMTQAHFPLVGLQAPEKPVRPHIECALVEDVPQYDFIIAPFSRSLPEHEKWPAQKWQTLTDLMPNHRFALFGTSKHDSLDFLPPNSSRCVTTEFDNDWPRVYSMMKKARYGVVSIVTGISHLAYACEVTNFLLESQGAWGVNPESKRLHVKRVCDIAVNDVFDLLCRA